MFPYQLLGGPGFMAACGALSAFYTVYVLGVFGRGEKKPKSVPVLSAVRPIPPSSGQKGDSLMIVVRRFEGYLDRMSAAGASDEEIKWQNKLRLELGSIKRSAAAGDFAAAKRRLSTVELYVKMIELHMAGR